VTRGAWARPDTDNDERRDERQQENLEGVDEQTADHGDRQHHVGNDESRYGAEEHPGQHAVEDLTIGLWAHCFLRASLHLRLRFPGRADASGAATCIVLSVCSLGVDPPDNRQRSRPDRGESISALLC